MIYRYIDIYIYIYRYRNCLLQHSYESFQLSCKSFSCAKSGFLLGKFAQQLIGTKGTFDCSVTFAWQSAGFISFYLENWVFLPCYEESPALTELHVRRLLKINVGSYNLLLKLKIWLFISLYLYTFNNFKIKNIIRDL